MKREREDSPTAADNRLRILGYDLCGCFFRTSGRLEAGELVDRLGFAQFVSERDGAPRCSEQLFVADDGEWMHLRGGYRLHYQVMRWSPVSTWGRVQPPGLPLYVYGELNGEFDVFDYLLPEEGDLSFDHYVGGQVARRLYTEDANLPRAFRGKLRQNMGRPFAAEVTVPGPPTTWERALRTVVAIQAELGIETDAAALDFERFAWDAEDVAVQTAMNERGQAFSPLWWE